VALHVPQWMASVGRCWPQMAPDSAEEPEPVPRHERRAERHVGASTIATVSPRRSRDWGVLGPVSIGERHEAMCDPR
jgi:hypothetical protein